MVYPLPNSPIFFVLFTLIVLWTCLHTMLPLNQAVWHGEISTFSPYHKNLTCMGQGCSYKRCRSSIRIWELVPETHIRGQQNVIWYVRGPGTVFSLGSRSSKLHICASLTDFLSLNRSLL